MLSERVRGGELIAAFDARDCRDAVADYLTNASGLRRDLRNAHPLVAHFQDHKMRLIDLAAAVSDRDGNRIDVHNVRNATGEVIGTGHVGDVLATWGSAEATAILDSTAADVRSVCTNLELDDYKAANFPLISASKLPELKIEDASIERVNIEAEGGEPIQIKSKTVKLAFSRHLVENDDRSAIAATFRSFGAMVGRRLGRDYSAILTDNANLTDGVALFASAEDNDLTSAGLDVAGLGASMAALRDRQSEDGEYFNAQPAVLIVPTAQEATAKILVESLDDANRLRVVALPWLSATYFYLAGDPQSAPSIALATLAGGNGALMSMRPSAKAPSGRAVEGSSRRESFDGAATDAHVAFGLAPVSRSIIRNTLA